MGEKDISRNKNRESRTNGRVIQWLGSHLLKTGGMEDVIADPAGGYRGPIVVLDSDTYEFDGVPSGTSEMAREGTYEVMNAMLQEFKDDAASGEYRYKHIGSSMSYDTDLILRRVRETADKVRES